MTAETTINVVKQNNEEYSIVGTLEHAESSFDSIFCCPIKELDELSYVRTRYVEIVCVNIIRHSISKLVPGLRT
jgi:hypothetical protein